MAANKPQNPSSNQPGAGQEMERSSQRPLARRSGMMDPFSRSPMGLMASNPFAMMRHMQHEMDRIFSQAFGGMGGGLSEMEGTGSTGMGMWSPPIEVSEREGKLNICAELPGLKPEEVRVEITPDGLIIEGERRSEDESTQGGIRRSERRYGRFFRSIPLPEGVDPEQVRAQFTNGLLDVQVPLPQQQSQRRQIPIQTGSSSTVDTTGQETKAQEAKR